MTRSPNGPLVKRVGPSRSRRLPGYPTARPFLLAAAAVGVSASALLADQSLTIVQKNRAFSQSSVIIPPGEVLRFTNDDGFPHQIYVKSAAFAFDSDLQPPGSTVAFAIPTQGSYRVLCGIHPKMRLDIEVR